MMYVMNDIFTTFRCSKFILEIYSLVMKYRYNNIPVLPISNDH